MNHLETRMAYYKSAIVKESERWLLLGRPIPLFVFTLAGPPPHKYQPSSNIRDLAPDGSGEKLIPVDYYDGWDKLKERFPKATEDLPSAPYGRYATVVMFEGATPTFMRLDLGHNRRAVEAVEEQKVRFLMDLLQEFRLEITSHDRNQHSLSPLRESIEALLAVLLQRPAAKREVELILAILA